MKFEKLGTISDIEALILEGDDKVITSFNGVQTTIDGVSATFNFTDQISQTISISPAYLTFNSSNTSVATVDDFGVVTTLESGTAVITASFNDQQVSGSLTINSLGAFSHAPIPTQDPAIFHLQDDNLETFLINLTRGSGLDGFTGIPAVHKNIARPLLIFSREEILNFATENAILWREDQSNASLKYIRNKIRHQIVPVLKEINPSLLSTFSKTIENLKESKQVLTDQIKEIQPKVFRPFGMKEEGSFELDIQEITKLSDPKAYLFHLLKPYHFTEFNDIVDLLNAQSGKKVVSKTHQLLKNRTSLLLTKIDQKEAQRIYYLEENVTEISHPISLNLQKDSEKIVKDKNTIYVSKEKLTFPLIIRKWENGDSFYPVGMKGSKKISKYFKDEKYSLLEKEQTWLLCNNDQKLIWIIGKRQDSRFQTSICDENTVRVHLNT